MKIKREELLCEEPITKDQFKKIARFLDMTYPAKTKNDIPFLAERETFDVWYELLKNNLYLPMYLGMCEYCLENKYPPAVSDIEEYTHRFTVKICELKRIIENNFDFIKRAYFSLDNKTTKEEYIDLILEDEQQSLDEYIFKTNRFSVVIPHICKSDIENFKELKDLWKNYWKKQKNPS